MAESLMDRPDNKSWWLRPEGKTGIAVLALGAMGLYVALPYLLTFMSGLVLLLGQTYAVGAMALGLFIIFAILSDKKFQTLCKYFFKGAMRKLAGALVELDPINIMKGYVEGLKEKRSTMEGARDKLQGQIRVLEQKIRNNEKVINDANATAKIAHDRGNAAGFKVNVNQAGRLTKLTAERYKPLLAQLQIHLRAVNKYHEVTGIVIADIENEVEARIDERSMIMASYSAMSAAKKIMQGGTDEKELFDQAMEYVANDFNMKIGEIDAFIESSQGFVATLDLQNDVFEAEALKKFQEWEGRADSVLLGETGKRQLLEHTAQMPMATAIGAPAAVDFDKVLRK